LDKFHKFIPLTKVEEQPNGDLFVYGEVTAERPDRDGEICKYASTVPFYKAYAEELSKATTKAGIEESIMPLREMHQLSAVGCGKSMDCLDDDKTIKMGFNVVDKSAIEKVKKGVYTGFSQGGSYVKKWTAPWTDPETNVTKNYTWYISNPGEVSLVDSPCLSTAHFDYVKADGSVELRKFATAPAASPSALSDSDVDRIAAALKKTLTEPVTVLTVQEPVSTPKTELLKGLESKSGAIKAYVVSCANEGWDDSERTAIRAALKTHKVEIHDVAEDVNKAIEYLRGDTLQKGMYEVASLAQMLSSISYLQASAAYERDYEQDASSQPEDLADLLSHAIKVFAAMVAEETSELESHAASVAAATSKGAKAMTQDELNKASEAILEKAKGAKTHLKALAGHVAAMKKAHMADCDTAAEHIGKCAKALGVDSSELETAGDGPTTEGKEPSTDSMKAISDQLTKLSGPDFAKSLLEGIMPEVKKAIEQSQVELITALVGGAEEADKIAKGLGNRELIVAGKTPQATTPVTKAADSATAVAATNTDDKPLTPEEIIKANQGDPVLRLRLAKQIRVATPAESNRIQESMSMAGLRK
jgi:hypothetical protein